MDSPDPAQPSAKPRPNHLAVASLVCALGSLPLLPLMALNPFDTGVFLLGVFFWLLAVSAIFTAILARRRVSRSATVLGGYHMATCSQWVGFFMAVIFPFAMASNPCGCKVSDKANQAKAINNLRQVLISLRLYAADHNGKYPDAALPDAQTSNEVFRELLLSETMNDEMIFGCPSRIGSPDGNIGKPLDPLQMLRPGENHWAMTRGLDMNSSANIPLAYDNPATATWPPLWVPEDWSKYIPGTPFNNPGMAWSGNKIIVGLNDSSVVMLPLVATKGSHLTLKPRADGTPIFPMLSFPVSVLNIDTGKR